MIVEIIKTKEYDLLILDELIATINNGFIEFVQKCELMDTEISALERNNFHKESIDNNTIWIRNPLTL